MNFKFLKLIKYYTSKKSEPILDFIPLNENLSVLILKNNSTNLGYVGTINMEL
jgi:hypothetical protein